MTLSQKNNVNLMYGCDVARIYYHQNEFYAMLITMEEIAPFATKSWIDGGAFDGKNR